MTNIRRSKVDYGLTNALQSIPPQPIIAHRAPTSADKAELGTLWIEPTDTSGDIVNGSWVLTSIIGNAAFWSDMSGGTGVFTALTVNPGPTNLSTVGNGAVTIGNVSNTQPITISVGSGNFALNGNGHTINLGTDNAANTTTLGSTNTSSNTTVQAGTSSVALSTTGNGSITLTSASGGAIALSSGGNVSMVPATTTVASPTNTATINHRVGSATFTGFTTANGAAQVFNINCTFTSTTAVIFVSVSNEGSNDAQMTITRVNRASNSQFQVTLFNNGSAALNGNITINFWIIG